MAANRTRASGGIGWLAHAARARARAAAATAALAAAAALAATTALAAVGAIPATSAQARTVTAPSTGAAVAAATARAAPAGAGAAGGPAGAGAGAAPAGLVPGAAPRPDGEVRPECGAARTGQAQCFVLYSPRRVVGRAAAAAGSILPGWGARQLEQAYRLPAGRQARQTVAVSIAFDTPGLEQFLAVYRRQFGLPPCTSANGCFRKVNQRGQASPLPPSGVFTGWDLEATLDVSMISAACPHCRILVVEASTAAVGDLAATDATAARLGAQVISNSYGTAETGFSTSFARDYEHRGHTFVVSSGDSGFGPAFFPADLANVTAVGGTSLSRARDARGWSEQVWNSSGGSAASSACSAYMTRALWQHGAACSMRTTADVSAVAVNVAEFEPTYGGWLSIAGTSVSAPLIAGIYGLAGNAATIPPGYAYRHAAALFDVTTGNNDPAGTGGASCDFDYLCTARKGYDAPTGLGTPDGLGAF
jgi:hypothetical protein